MAGDRHSFAAGLASRYSRRLKRFFSARVRNRADASDLAQEVYLRLLRIGNHESIRSPESYLFTIASHTLHQYTLRRTAVPEEVDINEIVSELQSDDQDDPAVQAETKVRIERLQRALAQLPPVERAALLMHRFAGFSIEEIGDQLGVARVTAKKYLAKALVHCRGMEDLR